MYPKKVPGPIPFYLPNDTSYTGTYIKAIWTTVKEKAATSFTLKQNLIRKKKGDTPFCGEHYIDSRYNKIDKSKAINVALRTNKPTKPKTDAKEFWSCDADLKSFCNFSKSWFLCWKWKANDTGIVSIHRRRKSK